MAVRYLGGGVSFEQKAVSQEFSEESSGSSLAGLTDVDITNPSNGDTLVYNSTTEKWENGEGGGGSSTLAGLTDVDLTSPSDGQVLVYNATSGKWENGAGGGSGTLVVRGVVEGEDTRLDHTYAEIISAGYAVFWNQTDIGNDQYTIEPLPVASLGHGGPDVEPVYFVTFIHGQNQDVYTTSTQNGYPTLMK